MIVIFEGPQGVGKTSILTGLCEELTRRKLPFEQWKVERGTDPITDMNATLDNEFKERKIYLLDRFHLSEWVINKGTRRNWAGEAEWLALEAQYRQIDERLRQKYAFIFCITANPYFVEKRLNRLNKEDVLGTAQNSDFWWRIGVQKTRVDCVHLINNDFYQMKRNIVIIADILESRWSDELLRDSGGSLASFAAELGAIEGTEEGQTPSV